MRAEGRDDMPERRSMCALRVFVLVAATGSGAATLTASWGAAPAAEACAAKPSAPAPQGQHWYYVLDRAAKRQCWHLGPLGIAMHRSTTARLMHRGAVARAAAAVPPAKPQPSATEATATPGAAPAVSASAAANAPPMPPPELAAVSERWPASEPAPQVPAASETRAPDTISAAAAPAARPAEAPAAITQPSRPAAAGGEADHTFALMVLAVALLTIVGPVWAAMRWWSGRKAGVESASARPVRRPPPRAPAVVALAERTVVRQRPAGVRNRAPREIGHNAIGHGDSVMARSVMARGDSSTPW